MSKKVFNRQGGKHSAAAYAALENRAYGSCVANLASFVVSAGAGMNVNISTGDGLISVDSTLARRIQVDATETATVPAASASFNRIDSVVAYIDTAVSPTTSVTDNTNNILKFVVVAGTASASLAAPTGAAILSAIGAGKPYMVLYDLLLPQNAANVSGITLTDRRVVMAAPSIADGIVTTAKLGNLAVTNAKINDISALKFYNPHKFAAYRTGAHPLTASVYNKVQLNAEDFDTSNNYDAVTNYRFTAPVTGFYQFDWAVASLVTSGSTDTVAALYKNGAAFKWGNETAAAGGSGGSALIRLTAGEYVELYVYQTTNTALNTASPQVNNFSGFLVSTT